MTDLPTLLRDLERLARDVSPTDWHWDSDPIKDDPLERWRFRICTVGRTVTQMYYDSGDRMVESEMKLICALKNSLPTLLAALRENEQDARRYRWLNKQSDFLAYIRHPSGEKTYRLKCGEVLDRWIDERITEELTKQQALPPAPSAVPSGKE